MVTTTPMSIKRSRRSWLKQGGLLIPAALAFPSILRPATVTFMQPAATAGPSYLVSNDLTAGSLPSGWTNQAGSPNWAYDATGLGMVGNTVLDLDGTAATESVDHPAFTDATELWGFFEYHPLTLPGGARELIRFLVSGAQADGCEITIDASGRLYFVHGTTSVNTVAGLSVGTTYRIWWYYKQETSNGAADGLSYITFSTTNTKPTTGNNYASRNTNTGFTAIDQCRITAQFSTSGPRGLIARFRVDDANIGDNPT